MKTTSQQLSTVSLELLANVAGGAGNAPLGGNVTQDINTNWGGTQTNIDTQIINPPPRQPTTMTEYMRQNPAARLEHMRRHSTPVRR